MAEAIDLLKDRLTDRLDRVRRHRSGHRQLAAPPRRAMAEQEHRPHRLDRQPEDRRIVRHKSYSLPRQDAWAAVAPMVGLTVGAA
ncbi:hypothetical protein ABT095_01070 [Kitasatospora sp. NPDC002227]|uniref:hypothetical protein n=1 Tax=Kitasatospora sp. NPDC002227 TaxID=3154773 RepID=UPI0033267656